MADTSKLADTRKFDYVVARSQTRESSTLTIATVAASASLVLIALYIQAEVDVNTNQNSTNSTNITNATGSLFESKYKASLPVMGILFSIIGIAYREVTALTVHRNDQRWLLELLRDTTKETVKDNKGRTITDPVDYSTKTGREPLFRSLLVSPVIAWGYMIDQTLFILIIIASAAYVVVLGLVFRGRSYPALHPPPPSYPSP